MSATVGLVAVLALIGANALFVAVEFSVVAVDRTQVRLQAAEGSRPARTALTVLRRLSFHLSAAQLGITLCSLGLGVLAEPVVAPLLEPALGGLGEQAAVAWSVALALLLTTVVQMVVGELVPKGVAVARPLPTALALAGPLRVFTVASGPVVAVCDAAASGLLRLVGVEPAEELADVRSREELHRLVRTSEEGGTIRRQSAELLDRAFRFRTKTAADALTPRLAVRWLPASGTTGDLLDLSAATGLSRFPLVADADGDADDAAAPDLDRIDGVVHVKDVLGLPADRRRSEPLASMRRAVLVVPETRRLDDLMSELRHQDGQFAVVLDEYGSTAGIVTLEDLVEEIVGDIADEHDPQLAAPPVRRWAGAHLVSGRLHPDEVRDACGFEVPPGDYDTLAGFVLQRLGRIPEVGDGWREDDWDVRVVEMDHLRVATVRLVAPVPDVAVGEPAPGTPPHSTDGGGTPR